MHTATSTPDLIGAEALLRSLESVGVDIIFGLPGVHNLAVWNSCAAMTGMRMVGVRHEQATVYAADGFARGSGRLGVAIVTTGPGAANTLGATGEAMASGVPVMVIATDISSTLRRPGVYRGVLHENRDQSAMFEPVTKRTFNVESADDIAATILEASAVALQAPCGPVFVNIPTNFLRADVHNTPTAVQQVTQHQAADAALLKRAAQILETAKRPLIWAGGGALRAGAADQVSELALLLSAPVMTTYNARGILAPDHPALVVGPPHAPHVGQLWDEADVVLAIGSDFDAMMTQNWAMPVPPQLISINVDAADAVKNYPSTIVVEGDAGAILTALIPLIKPRDEFGLDQLPAIAKASRDLVQREEPNALKLMDSLEKHAPKDAMYLLDMCIAGYWFAGFGTVPGPRQMAYPMGWGTLGYAFPAALGAALSGHGRAICIVGDGGFLFACGELATLAQEGMPVTTIIVDDGGYGMLRYDQEHSRSSTDGMDLNTPDFLKLVESFGLTGTAVDGFGDDFDLALQEYTKADGPNVIVVSAKLSPPPTSSARWYRTKSA